jgi:predicted transposase/invertase (TIGR01784 family)
MRNSDVCGKNFSLKFSLMRGIIRISKVVNVMPEDIIVPDILPPSDDGIFKTIMTHPDGEPVLRGVVSDVLNMNFVSVAVRNVEMPISDTRQKRQRYDVNCRAVADSGKQIDIEMQAEPMGGDNAETGHRNIKSRAIFNLCDLHAKQPGRGTDYGDYEQSFQITFCRYNVFPVSPTRPGFVTRCSFRDEDGIELANDVGIIFIELTKLGKVLKKPAKDMTRLKQWCVFFGYADKPKYRKILDELITTREEIGMATNILTSISKDERERAIFRSRQMYQRDMDHERAVARKEGRSEGRSEIARNLLFMGLSTNDIAKATELSVAEIEALRNKGRQDSSAPT